MTPMFAIAATLIALGVGFGTPVFWSDLKEDLRARDYKLAAFDLFILGVLIATIATLLRDLIWRVR